ncbi:hypothetical protein MSG28_003706 [Choristoneura fumiferana]|uniref:Uncharacterized protein n=1 Tax=Choristoneura fumiferana TaxID=7141 RepID=A0ACC0KG37_CHOFU|nr:hypothetical protein MSG28_003706 [Choristoneura fumiferana]
MKRGCGLMLLEKASEGTAEESRHSVQQWSVEKGVENTSVASSTNEPSVVTAPAVGVSDREVPVPVLSDQSEEED